MAIDGDVDFVLLPRPALNAGAVRLSGRVTDDYVAVEQLSARLAFLPLLTGELKFRELVLTRADARITRSAEGRVDLLSPAAAPQPAGGTPAPPRDFDLDVERLVINRSTLVFQDIASAATVTLRDVNATINVAVNVTANGGMTVQDVPVTADAVVGRLGAGGVRTLSVTVKLDEADATAKFAGTLATRENELRGDLTLNGPSAASLAAGLGLRDAGAAASPAMQKPLALTAKLRGNGESLALDPVSGEIGGAPLKATLKWQSGTPAHIDIFAELGATALESWRTAALAPSPSSGFIGTARAQSVPPPAARFAVPKNLSATLDLRAPVLTSNGQTLSGATFKATLAEQVLTVADASISLPGASRLAATGTARLDGAGGIDAALTAQSGNLRVLLAWLGWTPPEGKLGPGRLGTGSFQAAVRSTETGYALDDVVAVIDISTFTGRAAWTPGPRPLLGLDLAVNTFNADAYVPLLEGTPTAAPAASPSAPSTGYGVTPAFAAFSSLADIDADVRLQIDAVTAGGIPGGKVGLDLGLKDGTLQLRTASFENVGGMTAWFSGGIGGFGAAPRFDDLQFDLSAKDIARVGRAFGFDVPEALKALTPVSLTGTLKGSLAESTVSATLKAASLTVQADGQALTLDQQPKYVFALAAAQPSYAALMKSMGTAWPFGAPDPGALKLAARIIHDKSQTVIEGLDLHIGADAAQGTLTITRGEQLTLNGTLTGVSLSLDRLLPPAPPRAVVAPVAAKPARRGAAPPAPKPPAWSEEPFDWSVLSTWQGTIDLSGPALAVRGLQAQDFFARLTFGEGAAEISDWKGKLFGAPGQLFLRFAAAPTPTVQGEIAFIGGDLAGVGAALNKGVAAPGKSAGKADFAGSFRAQGATPAALAASLSGSGTAKVNASDAGGGAISGFLGAITAANQLEGRSGPVTLEARFSAADGKIRIEDATVASKSYGGAFSGTIDIGRWLVDLTGRLRLESTAAAKPANVPITVKGALDLPNVTLLPAR